MKIWSLHIRPLTVMSCTMACTKHVIRPTSQEPAQSESTEVDIVRSSPKDGDLCFFM